MRSSSSEPFAVFFSFLFSFFFPNEDSEWQTFGQVSWGGQGAGEGPSACRRELFDITNSWA